MTHSWVPIQILEESVPSLPAFLGEVAVFAQVLSLTFRLQTIQEQVRFARAHFGTYESFRLCGRAHRLCRFGRTHETFLL